MTGTNNQRRIIITMTGTSKLIVSAKENYYNNDWN